MRITVLISMFLAGALMSCQPGLNQNPQGISGILDNIDTSCADGDISSSEWNTIESQLEGITPANDREEKAKKFTLEGIEAYKNADLECDLMSTLTKVTREEILGE